MVKEARGNVNLVSTVKVSSLTDEAKIYIRLMHREVRKRLIAPGPSLNQLLCMKLNPAMDHSSVLTPEQIQSMDMNFKIAVKNTYSAIERGKAAAAVAGSSSSSSAAAATAAAALQAPLPVAPSAATPAARSLGAMRLSLPAPADTAVVVSMPWEQEIEAFGTLSLPDFECALSTDRTDFFSMVFWADPSIVKKFPTLAALARGEFSGLAAEATSERTFSYSGRLFSKLRRRMSVVNLCAMVVGAAFPWQISDSEIMAEYESRLDRRRAAAAAAAAAASADAEDSD